MIAFLFGFFVVGIVLVIGYLLISFIWEMIMAML